MNTLYFDDVTVGQQIAAIDKGTITTTHIMRWSAAIENFHRIHYDQAFATGHDKLPGVLINGSWKQHILIQMIKDGFGHGQAGGWRPGIRDPDGAACQPTWRGVHGGYCHRRAAFARRQKGSISICRGRRVCVGPDARR